MIDNYLLEQLVTFAQEKTLAKTAQKLMLTQPTITRGMQRLEDELNVKLFERQPNKITLTKTGQFAAKKAAKVIKTNKKFIADIHNYDQRQQIIKVGSVAPGPLLVLENKLRFKHPLEILADFIAPEETITTLTNNTLSVIITNEEIQTEQIESIYLGVEQLYINLAEITPLATYQTISFADLKGLSFIVLNSIGPWKNNIQKNILNAKFIYQDQWDFLAEITKHSTLPYFSTNLTPVDPLKKELSDERISLPITDHFATMTFYISYLKQNKQHLLPFIKSLQQAWPTNT